MNETTKSTEIILEEARWAMKLEGIDHETAVKKVLKKVIALSVLERNEIRLKLARILVPNETMPIRTFNRMLAEEAINS